MAIYVEDFIESCDVGLDTSGYAEACDVDSETSGFRLIDYYAQGLWCSTIIVDNAVLDCNQLL